MNGPSHYLENDQDEDKEDERIVEGMTGSTATTPGSALFGSLSSGDTGSTGAAEAQEEKTNELEHDTYVLGEVIGKILVAIISVLLHIHACAIVLYYCKVAEAKILPYDFNMEPFTFENKGQFLKRRKNIHLRQELNIFYLDRHRMSNKVEFNISDNTEYMKEKWLNSYCNKEQIKSETTVFGYYIYIVTAKTVAFAFACFQSYFQGINGIVGEYICYYLGSFFIVFGFIILLILVKFYCLFTIYFNLPLLLSTKEIVDAKVSYDTSICDGADENSNKQLIVRANTRTAVFGKGEGGKEDEKGGASSKPGGDKRSSESGGVIDEKGNLIRFVNIEVFEDLFAKWIKRILLLGVAILMLIPSLFIALFYSLYVVFSVIWTAGSTMCRKLKVDADGNILPQKIDKDENVAMNAKNENEYIVVNDESIAANDDQAENEKRKNYLDYSIISLFVDLLIYRRRLWMVVITFLIVSNMAWGFGAAAIPWCFIVITFFYFFSDMFGDIYSPYIPKAVDHFSLANHRSQLFDIRKEIVEQIVDSMTYQPPANSLCVRLDFINGKCKPILLSGSPSGFDQWLMNGGEEEVEEKCENTPNDDGSNDQAPPQQQEPQQQQQQQQQSGNGGGGGGGGGGDGGGSNTGALVAAFGPSGPSAILVDQKTLSKIGNAGSILTQAGSVGGPPQFVHLNQGGNGGGGGSGGGGNGGGGNGVGGGSGGNGVGGGGGGGGGSGGGGGHSMEELAGMAGAGLAGAGALGDLMQNKDLKGLMGQAKGIGGDMLKSGANDFLKNGGNELLAKNGLGNMAGALEKGDASALMKEGLGALSAKTKGTPAGDLLNNPLLQSMASGKNVSTGDLTKMGVDALLHKK